VELRTGREAGTEGDRLSGVRLRRGLEGGRRLECSQTGISFAGVPRSAALKVCSRVSVARLRRVDSEETATARSLGEVFIPDNTGINSRHGASGPIQVGVAPSGERSPGGVA